MCLDFAVHDAAAKAMRDSFRSDCSCVRQAWGIPRFYLISQRRALTIRDGRVVTRWRPAARGEFRDFRWRREPASREISFNGLNVIIAVRCAREEARRIIREKRLERSRHGIGELVLLYTIPRVEDENAS